MKFFETLLQLVVIIPSFRGTALSPCNPFPVSVSDKVKGLLALSGKKQLDLAIHFGMSKQTMSNKMARESWSAKDLAKVAEFVGCKVGFVLPDGQHIFLEPEDDTEE